MKNRFKSEVIEKFLKENNMTKTELCRRSKVGLKTLNEMLCGAFNYRVISLFKLARVVGIEMCDFFEKD